MASKAIPSHLKPSSAAGNGDGDSFARKHHGKTQSHVVSDFHALLPAPAELHERPSPAFSERRNTAPSRRSPIERVELVFSLASRSELFRELGPSFRASKHLISN